MPSDPIRIHASAVFADGDGTPAGDDVVTVTADFPTCEIPLPGDVNLSGRVTSADIIYLLNYVFKGSPPPAICLANGDVNCDQTITSGDVIHLVNFVFKNGAPPCDVCALVEHGVWDCY